ncbi:DNA-directed RNA polymerase I subunit RPA1, partial [Armadillidium nasatum]
MGSLKQIPHTRIENLSFRLYSEEEIDKISVIHITKDESFNSLGHYFDKGIYDLHMGPMTSHDNDLCKTCNSSYFYCSGHFGHLKLPSPVYHPFFIDVLKEILQRVCTYCYRFQASAKRGVEFFYETKFLNAGFDKVEVSTLVQKAVNDPTEAAESMLDEEDEEENDRSRKKTTSVNEIGTIISELEKEFSKIKKNSTPSKGKCLYCQARVLRLRYQDTKFLIKNVKKSESIFATEEKVLQGLVSLTQPYLTTEQAMEMLRNCYKSDGRILKCLYPVLSSSNIDNPTDIFFLKKLLVIPPKYRPCNTVHGRMIENEMSVLYKYIIKWSKCLRFLKSSTEESEMPEALKFLLKELKGDTIVEKRFNIMCLLQGSVDNILDSEINKLNRVAQKGIRQVIEKKFGLFRRNLMGKRVNYSARSVAAPDPMLGVDEVGVPLDFAMKLSYPVPVTPWNVSKLRKLVQNGPTCFPGALIVEDEEGRKITLKADDVKQRIAISKSLLTRTESCVKKVNATKIVYRHLDNGDYVLMNRQPTLHKPSIQAHKVRVMPKDRVLRMPYANCKAYNADFDGDELNLHFSQNEMARSEAQHIITTQNQYLTPKDGSPLAGLIQDCIVASVMLTVRGKFFNKEDYQQLVYIALSDLNRKIRLLKPAILKPQQLWSGKQIISTILLNLIPEALAKPTFNFKTTVKVEMWQTQEYRLSRCGGTPEKRKESMTESEFIMSQGELLCGVIDKCAIGSTSYGLVHVCYDLYGGSLSTQFLTSIGRLCVIYLQWVGHTISLKEFVTSKDAAQERRTSLKELIQTTKYEVSKKLQINEENLEAHIEDVHKSENEKEMSIIDGAYTSTLGPTTSNIIRDNERSLYRNNLQNRMRMMIDTGAKGSRVNMNQMASLFGSVAIDGKRMPMSGTGKTLPSFKPYECDPRAGGYIPTRFVTGMDPRSYFFLCIVGRDSLQHTAVKTANSGYMQRCLIKHLEGIYVGYDMTVRNSDGVVLQFEYGEDGLDVTKVPFLRNIDTIDAIINPLLENHNHTAADKKTKENTLLTYSPEVEKKKKMIKKYLESSSNKKRVGGFLSFSAELEDGESSSIIEGKGRTENTLQLMNMWYNLPQKKKEKYQKQEKRKKGCLPISSMYSGSSQFGVVSEAIDNLIDKYYEEKYCSKRPEEQKFTEEQILSEEEKRRTIKTVLYMKAMKSRVDPGEAVGALCAQAIGEPLTQMTLNTFHFAGRDELNVTLGVPRMVEILRTASEEIKTPIMEVPFKPGVPKSVAEKLKVRLTPMPLDKVISHVDVTSSLEIKPNLCRRCTLRFSLHPYSVYKKIYYSKPEEVLHFMERFYFKKALIKQIKAAISKVNPFSSTTKKKDEEEENQEETDKMIGENLASRRGMEEEDSEDEDDPAESQEQNIVKETVRESLNTSTTSADKSRKKVKNSSLPTNDYLIRKNRVLIEDNWIINYDFDEESSLWCEITMVLPIAEGRYDLASIVKQTSATTMVHSVPGIKKAYVVEKDYGFLLRTEGVNIRGICACEDILDINRVYTNNIHLMAKTYGIGAAQRTIIKEIVEVQKAYDIKVDFRHLTTLADYFTREGVYKACSRYALDTCTSPIQKMSYETCFAFMKKALLQDASDRMNSPSANVMVGQPVKVGTNSMEILTKLS